MNIPIHLVGQTVTLLYGEKEITGRLQSGRLDWQIKNDKETVTFADRDVITISNNDGNIYISII